MHGNMVFSTHYILGTPQQSGGFLVCSVDAREQLNRCDYYYHMLSQTNWHVDISLSLLLYR